jgi:hypothetical protein
LDGHLLLCIGRSELSLPHCQRNLSLAIAVFYAFGTSIGACAPILFGYLLEAKSSWPLAGGYLLAALLMLIAALTEAKLGVDAEMRPLEDIADPLSGGGAARSAA